MKRILISCLTLMTVFAILTTYFAPVAQAQTTEVKEVNELAEILKFIHEEATVKGSNGEIVSIDVEMIEEKYGEDPVLEDLKLEIQKKNNLQTNKDQTNISPRAIIPPHDVKCIQKEMSEWAGGFVPTTVISSVWSYVIDGKYYKAAKKLIRAGVKGSVVGLATQLTMVWWKCK
ncbi:hypothetical protein JUJ52_03380 [Virgibacillus sp. AGTR]|uniref:hypothetical protein n=1 Tax=Virgibacillus sp. AGTR TaxID=2812055 RepID=UPI001D162FAD|nr:hypothetical protein [Virgibacillus sp. AGTR]MCC2249000.1 hypothetical protein [Virgibacillus sp. AGTR]